MSKHASADHADPEEQRLAVRPPMWI